MPARNLIRLLSGLLLLQQTGCFGLGIYVVGDEDFASGEGRGPYVAALSSSWTVRDHVIRNRGEPQRLGRTEHGCEVMQYDAGLSWMGLGLFALVVPIPLVVPVGRQQETFFVLDGQVVGQTVEIAEAIAGIGFSCGSNDCGFQFGRIRRSTYLQNLDAIRMRCGEIESPHDRPVQPADSDAGPSQDAPTSMLRPSGSTQDGHAASRRPL